MVDRSDRQNFINHVSDLMPYGLILLDSEWRYSQVNQSAERLFRFAASEVIGRDIWECMAEGKGPIFLPAFEDARRSGQPVEAEEHYPQLDKWILHRIVPDGQYVAVFFSDISKYKATQRQYELHKKNCTELLRQLPCLTYRCKNDGDFSLENVSDGSVKLIGIHPQAIVADRRRFFYDRVLPEYKDNIRYGWADTIRRDGRISLEYQIRHFDGSVVWVQENAVATYSETGNIESVEGIVFDISEKKKFEKKADYLQRHDPLTGLYNRMFFEEERRRLDQQEYLPLTVIIGDINGLKMINDALGETVGDTLIRATADILKTQCTEKDIVGRIGGDEFGILMPNADQQTADRRVQKIRAAISEHNRSVNNDLLGINLSIGYAVKDLSDILIDSTFKLADDYLGKKKLLERKSYHSSIVQSIKTSMSARSQETDDHAERLIKLTKSMGMILNMPQMELNELELFSTLHDIGKIGVPDQILNKPGRLSDDEWILMKRHSEIGYRIAMASSELMPIADYILAHHEHWDGSGYPRGIGGGDIPLPSRILAVADAYDAMTQDRVYRKAMPQKVAISEIRKNSGTQFDPKVVDAFLRLLAEEV